MQKTFENLETKNIKNTVIYILVVENYEKKNLSDIDNCYHFC